MNDESRNPLPIRAGEICGRHWDHQWLRQKGSPQFSRHIYSVLLIGPTSEQGTMTREAIRQQGHSIADLTRQLVSDLDALAKSTGP